MERNLPEFIAHHVGMFDGLEKEVALAYWNFALTSRPEDEAALNDAKRRLKAVYADRDAYSRVRTYDDDPQTADPILRRQLRLLRLRYAGEQMPKDVQERIVELEGEAERIVNSYRAVYAGRKLSTNDVTDVLVSSNDSEKRRLVWESARAVGAEVGPTILRLVGLRNRSARDLGYRDYYDMALRLQEIDEAALMKTVAEVLELTEAPYGVEKARLDEELGERFDLEPARLMPWHYADPFFQSAPPRKRIDVDKFYAGKDLVELTTRCFDGLGLEIRDILERSDLLPRAGKDQHAFCIHIDRLGGDVRVLSNNADTENWMSTMLHEFGHAAYDKYLGADLPYLLREPAHMLVTEAVAMFMGRLSKSADFLRTIAQAPKPKVAKAQKALEEQARLAMLIMARWTTVMIHFEKALYEDPGRDLDRTWWDLAERHQGLTRPPGRRNGDWASKIHLATAPVYYHNYLLGELVASQLKAAMASRSGAAAIVDRREVGDFLRDKVFAAGASLPWNELLEATTGTPLSPRFFVDGYLGNPPALRA